MERLSMEPLVREKVHFTVAKEIEKYIKEHDLAKGDILPSEKRIAEDLRIGRSSVREGLRLLEGMGLVEARPGKGIFVAKTKDMTITLEIATDRTSFLEVNDIRETLEIKACHLAIKNAAEEDLANLTAVYDDMVQKYEAGTIPHLEDMAFHNAIYKASHNEYLQKLLESIAYIFFKAWPNPYGMDDAFHESFSWHKTLYKAIIERDEQLAVDAIKKITVRNNQSVVEDAAPTERT